MRAALILAAIALAAPKPDDYLPRWKDGQTWRVEYQHNQPNVEPAREVWLYHVRALPQQGGWVLTITPPLPTRRYEVTLSPRLEVVKVMHQAEKAPALAVINDAESGGYRADSIRAPLLDWPDWAAGQLDKKSYKLSIERRGFGGFRSTFIWRKGKPWWSEAERRYGDTSVTARLL